MDQALVLILAEFGKKTVQVAIDFALNSAGQHLEEGPIKDEVLDLLNKVKIALA